MDPMEQEWAREQIAAYRDRYPAEERFATVLREILSSAARTRAPLAIVQSRPKGIASFAEKIQRKRHKYRDPVNQLTDLCGARVIAPTRDEAVAMADWVKERLIVDPENSLDVSERLGTSEFGYRSVHYVVELDAEADYFGVPIPPEVHALPNRKAEIQVRTVMEHAWADFSHDMTYKSAFELPTPLRRELAAVAAMLEEADLALDRIHDDVRVYATSFGAYMSPEEMRDEIELQHLVLEHDPDNIGTAVKIARLATALDDHDRVIGVLSPFSSSGDATVLRELGSALCHRHEDDVRGQAYREGQRLLEVAAAAGDHDALAVLAGTWKGIDEDRSRDLYRQAFARDPSQPYPLGNYLECEVTINRNLGAVTAVAPLIERSIDRCREQAALGVNLPFAHFDAGKFHLLLGRSLEALEAYAEAIRLSTAPSMIDSSLGSLERLAAAEAQVPGLGWARRLHLLGKAIRFPCEEATERVRALATPGVQPLRAPVFIVAGGCDPRLEEQMHAYHDLLLEAFRGAACTIISGGTREGVSGLAGDIREENPSVHTIGYVPRLIPADATVDRDPRRYAEIRPTDGDGFSPLEPIQNWIDIVASGIDPRTVRLIGINGGPIARLEYRLALGLGATVALIEGSGREAGKLLAGTGPSPGLIRLPADVQTVRAFVGHRPELLSDDDIETLAKTIHEGYRRDPSAVLASADPAMAPWESLPESLRLSNRDQAADIVRKLTDVGLSVCRVQGEPAIVQLTGEEIERLAEMEHGRFVVERLTSGWRHDDRRDPVAKTSPHLVGWADLTDETRDKDRDAVRRIPTLLASVGLEIRRAA